MALIEVSHLYKTYEDEGVRTRVLKDLSFEIKQGEFLTIMGPSGSGKSTLLHILGFLDRPTKGIYRFDDKTIDEYSDDELAHIRNKKMGFVFQSFNLLPRTTVFENVQLPLYYSKIKKTEREEMAAKAVKAVGLEHRMDYQTGQLSGGEKQRVAIARALVNDPSIIFADEPTGNLDTKSGRIIMEIIQQLHEEGHTIILITHETYTAEHAERIIRLLDGRIEKDFKVKNRHSAKEFFQK